ncbi:MAG: two-component system sensor histidine kinase QseC [Rheinheimera aquimaris]|jgi:two-component system sensor histidine kinase QseC|uniref:histidine kinase dimerization/phospho-acceptor domain-containing protein n=1 Tax=Rheinheimera aquimaris TaxID=412437 RepID=UPI000E9599EF|nr:two-component sensor histidine kinase [Rheinheimera sp.]|tara:strand:+ start:7929 stop:9314 length:1386 start_codon:yes stop_codon:yes gene_type:complete
MQINSIKVWLLIVINLIVICSLSFTALVSYKDAMHELDEIYDAQLARNARLVATMLTAMPVQPDANPLVVSVPEFTDTGENLTSAQERRQGGHKYEQKIAFQVWQDNRLVMASENAGQFPEPMTEQGYHELLEQGVHWISFSLPQGNGLWVFTAQREDVRQEMSEHIALAQIRPILVMMLPLSILIYLVVKLILRPLNRLQHSVAARQAEQLTEISLKQPAELQPIQQAINQLIQRVRHYIQQERRFVADAAHELRTPLSILQLHAQNLQKATSTEEQHEAISAIIDGSKRMTHLVNQLLTLSRLERIQDIHCSRAALVSVVEDALSQLPLPLLDKVSWQLDIASNIVISGDHILLQSALRNIFDNASKYAQNNSLIRVVATVTEASNLTLTVQNQSTVLPEPQRMGNRFFRHQGHQHIDGSGLGLSITQRIIELHGGSIQFEVQQPDRVIVTLALPVALA